MLGFYAFSHVVRGGTLKSTKRIYHGLRELLNAFARFIYLCYVMCAEMPFPAKRILSYTHPLTFREHTGGCAEKRYRRRQYCTVAFQNAAAKAGNWLI